MSQTPQEEQPVIGFITVVKNKQIGGMLGGYLILNRNGRPVEFHCTAPVRPTKTQRILYGPTLDSYIMGEQIARALVLRSSVVPQLILTDILQVQSLRGLVNPPVMLTEIPESAESETEQETNKTNIGYTENTENAENTGNTGNTGLSATNADNSLTVASGFNTANESSSLPDNLEETILPDVNSGTADNSELQSGAPEAAELELSEADAAIDLEKWRGAREQTPQPTINVPPDALLWCGVLLHPDKSSLKSTQQADRQNAERVLRDLEIDYDLAEPFERIRDAIREAQKSAA